MSHEAETTEAEDARTETASEDARAETASEDARAETASSAELRQYLTEEADRRDAVGQRIESVVMRLSKVMVAMVCLNMVIAGANVAMIATRSSVSRPAPSAVQTVPTPPPASAPAASALPSVAPSPAPQVAENAPPLATSVPAAAPEPALAAPVPAPKRVALLGTATATSRPSPVLASRQTRALAKARRAEPVLAGADQEEEADGLPSRPVERW